MSTTKISKPNVSLSLFANAKKQAPTKAKKVRETVYVPKINKEIEKFYKLKETIDNATAELNDVKGTLQQIGVDNFVNLYDKQGRKPDNFLLTSDCPEKLMFMVQDKYIKVTEEKVDLLKNTVPDLVETVTSYAFNPEVFDKHPEIAAAIEKAVLGMKTLTQYEKENLFTVKEDTHIVKGAINELAKYKNKKEVIDLIQPVAFFKNAE